MKVARTFLSALWPMHRQECLCHLGKPLFRDSCQEAKRWREPYGKGDIDDRGSRWAICF